MRNVTKYIGLFAISLFVFGSSGAPHAQASSESYQERHQRCHRIASEKSRLPNEPFDNYGKQKAQSVGGNKAKSVGESIGAAKRAQAQRAIYKLCYRQCMEHND